MRDRFPIAMIAGLAVLGVIGFNVMKGARRGTFADKLSTYRSEQDGARGLYLLLDQAHVPVGRQQNDFQIIETHADLALLGVRFVGDSPKHPRPPLLQSLLDGGTDDEPMSDEEKAELRARGTNAIKAPRIAKEEVEKLIEHLRNGATIIYIPAGHDADPLLDAVDVYPTRAEKRLELRTLVPAQPTAWTLGVERVETHVEAFLDLPPGAVPLLVDRDLNDKPVAALVPWGQGRLIVIGAPELAMNQSLARADNAQFWVSLTRALHERLEFDEFHHGFTSDRSMGEFAGRYGLQFATGQLLLGVMLWAAALKRFGRPRAFKEEKRVGATDALFATSRLYREGKHHAHAAQAIVKELASVMALQAGVSARAAPSDVSAALDARGRKDLAHALLDVARAGAAANSEAEVQGVARLAALARTKALHRKVAHR